MSVINQRLSPDEAKAEAVKINAVSQSILGRIADGYQARKNKSKPLVILLGEDHSDASHRAVQLSVMTRLYESFDPDVVSCGMEGSQVGLIESLEIARSKPISSPQLKMQVDKVSQYLRRSHPEDPINIAASAFYATSIDSPATRKALQYVLLREGYKSFFNDVAVKEYKSSSFFHGSGYEIDFSDDKVWEYYQRFVHKEQVPNRAGMGRSIDPASLDGTYFRNYFMACAADEHIKKHKPKLFIQLCGAAHVNGDGMHYRPQEGLVHFLEREGHNVLGMTLPSVVVKGGPPENIIHYAFDGAVKFPNGHTDLEKEWMDAVLPHVLPHWSKNFMKMGEQLVCNHLLRAQEPR